MPTTPVYSLPWPILGDPPNAPADFQELAEATEAALHTGTLHAVMPYATFSLPSGPIGAGQFPYVGTPTGVVVQGGITLDPGTAAAFTVPVRGMYQVTARAAFSGLGAGGSRAEVQIGNGGAVVVGGTSGYANADGTLHSQSTAVLPLAAGGKANLWYDVGAPCTFQSGILYIHYLGAQA